MPKSTWRRSALIAFSALILITLAFSPHPFASSAPVISSPAGSGPLSWNPRVNCAPTVVTVEQILGNQTNARGGASESGSIFNPGITSPYGPDNAKRWLTASPTTPPGWVSPGPSCTITNAQGRVVSAFVQINGVQRGFRAEEDWNSTFQRINGGTPYTTGPQSDTTFNVLTPGYGPCGPTNTTGCTHTLHTEIDHDWKGAGYCGPNTACDNSTLVAETAAYKSLVDVQGFVFWDSDHLNESAHSFSGWELHPLTAWRLSNTSSDYSLSVNPNPLPVMPGRSASSRITVNTFNLFSGNLSFTTTVTPYINSTGTTPTASTSPSTVYVSPGGTAVSTLTVSTTSSNTGNYSVTVIGTNGTLVRSVSMTVYVVDFSIAANPVSLSMAIGSSGQSTLTLASINGFSGTTTLTAQVSPTSLTAGLSPAEPTTSLNPSAVTLSPRGTGSATLTVSASLLTTPGTYTVTATATSGGVSHTVMITVTVTVAGLI